MKKLWLVILVVVLAVSSTALGWGVFNNGSGNNCAACHEGSVIMAAHGSVACLDCHVVTSGDVPATSNCSACHGAGAMVNFHNGAGITSCAMCHAELPNESCSWGELKSRYSN